MSGLRRRAPSQRTLTVAVAILSLVVAVGALTARAATSHVASAQTPVVDVRHTVGPIPSVSVIGPSITISSGADGAGRGGGEAVGGKNATVITLPELDLELNATSRLQFTSSGTIIYSRGWVFRYLNPGSDGVPTARSYGQIGPVPVKTLAFGAIPVSLNLELDQTVVNGLVQPLDVQTTTFVPYVTTLTGSLNVHVTDLTVDGKPLVLGSTCRTVTPARLIAHAYGLGSYAAVIGGTLEGTTIIPGFTGCLSPTGEDVSTLLDGVVSGPLNATFVSQSNLSSIIDPRYPYGCQVPCSDPPPLPVITAPITSTPTAVPTG